MRTCACPLAVALVAAAWGGGVGRRARGLMRGIGHTELQSRQSRLPGGDKTKGLVL